MRKVRLGVISKTGAWAVFLKDGPHSDHDMTPEEARALARQIYEAAMEAEYLDEDELNEGEPTD